MSTEIPRQWRPEANPAQGRLLLAAIAGEGALMLAGVMVAAASGSPELAAGAVVAGAGVMLATGVVGAQLPRRS